MTQTAATSGMESRRLSISFYITVGLIAGAIIALQIGIMRIFSIGTWSHFGSFVISIAMLGFGVMSAVMCIGTGLFQRYWHGLITASLVLFGPLMLVSNAIAQQLGFNPIELIANPEQKFILFYLFLIYFVPFLTGALFLGLVFLRGQHVFGKVYFADLAGSGLCGLVFLIALYFVRPDWILLVPFGLWAVGTTIWFLSERAWVPLIIAAILGAGSVYVADTNTRIAVNEFKGVSYARKFPDSKRTWVDFGPFGYLEAYTSSYLHFAPGLSDNAAVNLEEMPKNAYIAMYIDSDGPIGVMKKIPPRLTAYFEFLPMYMPYVLKKNPDVFIVQLGGGISTNVALAAGAKSVSVAESNPLIREALTGKNPITAQTGNPLLNEKVTLVPFEGRLFLSGEKDKYDVIDLSLADSTGLSHAGGFSVVEKYNYTKETLQDYMTALKPDGILGITLWNKEDLPKSVPKFFSTVIAAGWEKHDGKVEDKFFILHTYLSTVTVLYKKNGFTAEETDRLLSWTRDMSYEVLHAPGKAYDVKRGEAIFRGYRASHFDIPGFKDGKRVPRPERKAPGDETPRGETPQGETPKPDAPKADAPQGDPTNTEVPLPEDAKPDQAQPDQARPDQARPDQATPPEDVPPPSAEDVPPPPGADDDPAQVPPPGQQTDEPQGPRLTWGNLYRLMLNHLMKGEFDYVQEQYVFDTRPLTNNRPYFAAYIKALEIPNFLDQLDSVSDEWGYLLLWATLLIAGIFGFLLMMVPVVFGWRTIFSRQPGKIGLFVYFFCLGFGYITVEVGLIGKFLVALSNPTITASVLITSMLFFSGLGSLVSGRYIDRCRRIMPRIFVAIALMLVVGAFVFDPILAAIGQWPYWLRVAVCILLVAPLAFLMGFPFPMAMAMLSNLGKERFFLWAWGINGTFSVVGAVAVPIVNVLFGMQTLIIVAGGVYLLALPCFFSVLRPPPADRREPGAATAAA